MATLRSLGLNAGRMNAYSWYRITGSEIRMAAYAELVNVVVNCSVMPKVIGSLMLSGSGLFTISRMSSFCQPQNANAMPKAITEMISRVAQLAEVVDEREPLLVIYGSEASHGGPRAYRGVRAAG